MDRLQPALDAAIPLLREMESGLGRKPTAPTATLEKLRELHLRRKGETSAEPTFSIPRSDDSAGASPSQATPVGDATSPRNIPDREWTLATLREAALRCTECPRLVASRTQVVFGVGNPNAELMFVGEAPGADEDIQGEPFVGKAGQLLTKIIQTMGFARETVYIGNVLKCRPDMPAGSTGNRKPTPEEMRTCFPWLEKQISLIQPKVLVALGATAVEGLLGDTRPMNQLRGRWLDYTGIPVMPTYHPAYLLRNQSLSEKRKVWEDMLLVLEKLGAPISEKQRGFFLQK
jgi:DNA polymerase